MNRRDMLKETALAMLASQLPLPAAPQGNARTPALDPLPDYLANYHLPKGGASDPAMPQTLVFDVVEWRVGPKRLKVTNAVIGSLTVERRPETDRTVYRTTRNITKVETVTGQFTCANDTWRSLREWHLGHTLHRGGSASRTKLLATQQTGRATADGYTLARDGGTKAEPLQTPLLCQAGLIDRLPGIDLAATPRFAFVDGASGVRPDQRLRLQGEETVASETTRSILQTGHATLPTHWIVDAQRRPLFITTFLLSLALVEIR
jgi:hypothetical protein